MNYENEKIEITKENIMQLGFFNTTKDINFPDGTNIKKGTEFLIDKNYEDLRYEVHFSEDERNNYNSEFGDNYLFSLDQIKSFAEPTENSIKKYFDNKNIPLELRNDKEEVINTSSRQIQKSIDIDKNKEIAKHEAVNAVKSNWLLSKLNISNEKVLERIEKIMVGVNNIKLSLNPIKGELNFKHLNDINKSLYGCLYTLPEIPIDKISNCKSILKELKNEKLTKTKDINDFVDKTTKHISKLYDMNVFEKGNVSTLKEFTRILGMSAGFNIDFSKVSNSDFEFSCIKGNLGTFDNLNKLIKDNTINFEPQKNIMREFIKYIDMER